MVRGECKDGPCLPCGPLTTCVRTAGSDRSRGGRGCCRVPCLCQMSRLSATRSTCVVPECTCTAKAHTAHERKHATRQNTACRQANRHSASRCFARRLRACRPCSLFACFFFLLPPRCPVSPHPSAGALLSPQPPTDFTNLTSIGRGWNVPSQKVKPRPCNSRNDADRPNGERTTPPAGAKATLLGVDNGWERAPGQQPPRHPGKGTGRVAAPR